MYSTENDKSSNRTVACICCQGNMFTELLPGTVRGMHIKTHRLTGGIFYKYTIQRSSGAMIYTPSFIKLGSDIQKFMEGHTHTHTHTQHGSMVISYVYFHFLIKKFV
jgi:hypothetical protein